MNWLIEEGMFTENEEALIKELKAQNQKVATVKYIPFGEPMSKTPFDDKTDVIFYGSLGLCQLVQKERPNWSPGAIGTWDNFLCSTYYPHFGNLLLNADHEMTTIKELNERKDYFFETFGQDNTIFIRPDSGLKMFTGTRMYKEAWEELFKLVTFYDEVKDDSKVLVSSPKNIKKEYRFVISEGKVITGSSYRFGEELSSREYNNPVIYKWVEQVLTKAKWEPDRMWTLDLADTGNQFKILEIGCFSGAGLYSCNLKKIIERVLEL